MSGPDSGNDVVAALPPSKRRRRESFDEVELSNGNTARNGSHLESEKESHPACEQPGTGDIPADIRGAPADEPSSTLRQTGPLDEKETGVAGKAGDGSEEVGQDPTDMYGDIREPGRAASGLLVPANDSSSVGMRTNEAALGEHGLREGNYAANEWRRGREDSYAQADPVVGGQDAEGSGYGIRRDHGGSAAGNHNNGPTAGGYPAPSLNGRAEDNEQRPVTEHGPQQSYGNRVLTAEVAEVLNALFLRGFFEDRDIDDRAIDLLGSVPPELALTALEDIQHRDFSTVRNKPAFIFSIFKRVISAGGSAPPQSHVPPGGFPPSTVPPSALAHLPDDVSNALQRVFTSGVCHPSQFDDRAMDILVELHPDDAVRALSEFAAMEPGRVRNPSAFWMGLARKYKNQAQNGGSARTQHSAGYVGSGGYGSGVLVEHAGVGVSDSGAPPPGSGIPPGVSAGGGLGSGYGPGPGGYLQLEQRLEELAEMGVLPRDALDHRAADALRKLPERDALSVLAELPEPSRVRNMSAYVMGLCKKFAMGEARSLMSRGGMTGGGSFAAGGPGGGAAGMGGPGIPGVGGGGGGYGGNDIRELHDALSHMDPDVRGRFYAMVDRRMFSEHAFDHRAIGALQAMNVGEACAALDELAASDPRRIHNISAYFMGLARKFARG